MNGPVPADRLYEACGRGMILETLRYADEVYRAQGYFRDIPDDTPDPELLGLADRIYAISEGRLTGEVARADATQEVLMEYMTAGKD